MMNWGPAKGNSGHPRCESCSSSPCCSLMVLKGPWDDWAPTLSLVFVWKSGRKPSQKRSHLILFLRCYECQVGKCPSWYLASPPFCVLVLWALTPPDDWVEEVLCLSIVALALSWLWPWCCRWLCQPTPSAPSTLPLSASLSSSVPCGLLLCWTAHSWRCTFLLIPFPPWREELSGGAQAALTLSLSNPSSGWWSLQKYLTADWWWVPKTLINIPPVPSVFLSILRHYLPGHMLLWTLWERRLPFCSLFVQCLTLRYSPLARPPVTFQYVLSASQGDNWLSAAGSAFWAVSPLMLQTEFPLADGMCRRWWVCNLTLGWAV